MKALALAAVVAVTLVPTQAGAQGLAEVARRAEDSRKGSPAPGRTLTDKDLPNEVTVAAQEIGAHELNARNFQAFMNTRRAYVKLLIADAPLRGRMQARMVQARSIDSTIAIWSGEESVLALIRENGTNPREFLLTELAVAQAVLVLKKSLQQSGSPEGLPPAVERNMVFVRSHLPEIESFAREIQALASQMP
jgi:hypothetical protein